MAATLAVLAGRLWLRAQPWPGARWAALALLAASLPLFTLPFVHLGRYGESAPGDAYMQTTRVADRGIYGVVRHPQYLGYMLLAVGFALLSPHPLVLGAAAVAVAAFVAQAALEERALLDRFGPAYAAYRARVPRFNVLAGLWRKGRDPEAGET